MILPKFDAAQEVLVGGGDFAVDRIGMEGLDVGFDDGRALAEEVDNFALADDGLVDERGLREGEGGRLRAGLAWPAAARVRMARMKKKFCR